MGVKKTIGQFRQRVRFKANYPTSDGAGGYTDSIEGYDLEVNAYEVWANVEVKTASRDIEQGRTVQVRKYKIITRATFGYSMNYVPKKNMKVEIVGYTTNDAVVHSAIYDDWKNHWIIEAQEEL